MAGLVVPGCEGPSTMAKSPTYAVLLRNQLCRELRARWGGGVAKKWRMMTRGRGGGTIPPKNDDVIYEQPLMLARGETVWWILAEMWLLWWGVCVARWCGGAIKWNGAKRLWGWFHQFTPKVASNRLRRPISEYFSSELRSQLAPVSMHLIGKGVCQISFSPTLHLSFGIVVRWQYVSFKLWSETNEEANCSLYCVLIFNSFLYKFKYLILAVS